MIMMTSVYLPSSSDNGAMTVVGICDIIQSRMSKYCWILSNEEKTRNTERKKERRHKQKLDEDQQIPFMLEVDFV